MKISELADQVRNIPLREVLERYGFEAKPEGTTLRAKSEHHNIVVTGSRWFDNKAGVGGAGAIDLVIHIAKVDFSAACRSLADQVRSLAASQTSLSFPKSSRQLPHQEKKSFEELATIYAVRDDTKWPIARAYLVEKRKIAADLVDELHREGAIYRQRSLPKSQLGFPSSRLPRHRSRSQLAGYQAPIRISAMLGKQTHRMVRSGRRHHRAQDSSRRIAY